GRAAPPVPIESPLRGREPPTRGDRRHADGPARPPADVRPARKGPMNVHEPATIRNVVLVGHSGAGKTTLADGLLFAAGAITRMGRVEDGNTVSDHDPEEIRRGISVSLSLAPVEWTGVKINLLDAP